MKKIKIVADFILKYWALVGIVGVIFGFAYKNTFGVINNIEDRLDDIKIIATENRQMSLKNTIWNENIPIEDRAAACDIYLSLNYNSYTKKKCELILENNFEN